MKKKLFCKRKREKRKHQNYAVAMGAKRKRNKGWVCAKGPCLCRSLFAALPNSINRITSLSHWAPFLTKQAAKKSRFTISLIPNERND